MLGSGITKVNMTSSQPSMGSSKEMFAKKENEADNAFHSFFLSNRNLILCPVKNFTSQLSLQMIVTKYRPMVCGWKVLYGLPGKLLICVSDGGVLAGLTQALVLPGTWL